jgi:exosortase
MHIGQPSAAVRLNRRLYAFVAVVLLSCSICYSSLAALARLLTQSSEYSHIALVLPVSVGLIYLAHVSIYRDLDSMLPFGITVMGTAALVGSLVRLRVVSLPQEFAVTISVFLLVTFWIGGFCACFGSRAGRKALFPLLFLYLLVPVPQSIMARMVVTLQHASADVASSLYSIAGVPVVRQGQFFVLSNEQIEVAEECSGIRSSIALLVTGLVFGHLFLRKNWSKILLIAAIVPLAVFKNGLRIFALSFLANYIDSRFLSGPLHHRGGIFFFSIALAVLVLLLLAFRRLETLNAKTIGRAVPVTGQNAR